MKIIGVSQRVCVISEINESRDCLDQRWASFFLELDLIPVAIPNCLELFKRYLISFKFDGFLLTGGKPTPNRDACENAILEYSIQNEIPLLGVCHGMQVIQQYFGINVFPVTGHVAHKQTISVNKCTAVVNSYHDNGTDELHPEFSVWAEHPPSRIIKGIKHKKLPLLGMMWHPERLTPYREQDISLFRNFFEEKK